MVEERERESRINMTKEGERMEGERGGKGGVEEGRKLGGIKKKLQEDRVHERNTENNHGRNGIRESGVGIRRRLIQRDGIGR